MSEAREVSEVSQGSEVRGATSCNPDMAVQWNDNQGKVGSSMAAMLLVHAPCTCAEACGNHM